MQITRKHFLKLLIALLIGLGIFGLFLFFRGGENQKLFNRIQAPLSNSQNVSFVASDGYKLSGTYWTSDSKERRPVIILSHQFNSTRHDFDSFIPVLLENGYAVLAYDTRGFGESKNGAADINDFPKDVIGAIDFLKKQREADVSRIGIIGASVGANVAFVSSGITSEIQAAVALSPSNTGARGVLLGNDIPNFSPNRIFIASDEREKSDADFIFAKSGEPKEQHVYPGFGHGIGLLRSDRAQNDILSFLKRLLDSTDGPSVSGNDSSGGSIVIDNQGGSVEGHTPRGFKGMGSGLFAGDNLSPNFPNGDGVQIFLTFDLGNIASNVVSATLRSENVHIQGSPFKNLGALKVETIKYDEFSSALWNVKPSSFACEVTDMPDGKFECDVTSALRQILADESRSAQFRIRFERAGNSDGRPDLAMFYKTNSNTNEPGIFQLEIKVSAKETSSLDIIHVPVALHLVKNSGAINTARSESAVLDLFQKSQAVWNQANIVFDASIEETILGEDTQKAVRQGNFGAIYKTLSSDRKTLHIFFVNDIGGSNGIAIAPSLALIADQTTVNDFRATAHEIGHLLGLSHTNTSEERLLFQGVNGTQLTQEEINISRLRAEMFML